MTPPKPRPFKKRRRRWDIDPREDWPYIARYLGLAGGLAQIVAGYFGLPINAAGLTFCGSLLVAPLVAAAGKRKDDS
jgi:hypothetical protein